MAIKFNSAYDDEYLSGFFDLTKKELDYAFSVRRAYYLPEKSDEDEPLFIDYGLLFNQGYKLAYILIEENYRKKDFYGDSLIPCLDVCKELFENKPDLSVYYIGLPQNPDFDGIEKWEVSALVQPCVMRSKSADFKALKKFRSFRYDINDVNGNILVFSDNKEFICFINDDNFI